MSDVRLPGRRLFVTGAILMLLTAAAHTVGHFIKPPPEDQALASVIAAMKGYTLPLGMGMSPSFHDISESLSLTFSICLVLWAVQNLLVVRATADTGLLLRLTATTLVANGALVALYWHFRIPPPLISLALVEVFYAASLAVQLRARA